MKRSLPIRRSVAMYTAAWVVALLLMTAPVYAAVAGSQGSAEVCGCCAHSHEMASAACCVASHLPATLPALPAAAWQFVILAAAGCCMVLSPGTALGLPSVTIRTGSPPRGCLTPLRI